jgi:class 3 adenylate cyclase
LAIVAATEGHALVYWRSRGQGSTHSIGRGAHVGQCLVVTLNERLDYFGQKVNLAARVQGLAAENDIYMSDEIYR